MQISTVTPLFLMNKLLKFDAWGLPSELLHQFYKGVAGEYILDHEKGLIARLIARRYYRWHKVEHMCTTILSNMRYIRCTTPYNSIFTCYIALYDVI